MAYSIIKTEQGDNGGNGYYTEFMCDSVDDVANLPTAPEYGGPRPGSLALVGTDGTIYILTNDREWSEFSMSGGGNGGSTGSGVLVIKQEDVATPTVDGVSSNTIYGDDSTSVPNVYLYTGDFSALGSAEDVRLLGLGYEDEPEYVVNPVFQYVYGTIPAVTDISDINSSKICVTADTPYVSITTDAGTTVLISSDAALAVGTGR